MSQNTFLQTISGYEINSGNVLNLQQDLGAQFVTYSRDAESGLLDLAKVLEVNNTEITTDVFNINGLNLNEQSSIFNAVNNAKSSFIQAVSQEVATNIDAYKDQVEYFDALAIETKDTLFLGTYENESFEVATGSITDTEVVGNSNIFGTLGLVGFISIVIAAIVIRMIQKMISKSRQKGLEAKKEQDAKEEARISAKLVEFEESKKKVELELNAKKEVEVAHNTFKRFAKIFTDKTELTVDEVNILDSLNPFNDPAFVETISKSPEFYLVQQLMARYEAMRTDALAKSAVSNPTTDEEENSDSEADTETETTK